MSIVVPDEFNIGETVYIAGLSNGKLIQGLVIHQFEHDGPQYVIEIDTPAGPLLEVRQPELIATDPNGPLSMWAKLTKSR